MMNMHDGSIENRYDTQDMNDETWTIPPGSGSAIESTFPKAGLSMGVDHAMNDVVKGAAFAVAADDKTAADDHPEGTWMPPKGSEEIPGPSMMTGTSATSATDTGPAGNMTDTVTNATDRGNQTDTGKETSSSNRLPQTVPANSPTR